MTPNVTQDECERMLAVLSDEPRVYLAYLFGSAAAGTAGPMSDLDVAVLLDGPPDFEFELALRSRVQDAVANIDLVILNNAGPVLLYEVITSGRCILAKNQADQAEFEITSLSRYLDFQPFRRVQQQYLRERIKERRGTAA